MKYIGLSGHSPKLKATTPPVSSPFCSSWRPPHLILVKAARRELPIPATCRAWRPLSLKRNFWDEKTQRFTLAIGQFQISLFQHFGRISFKQIMCDDLWKLRWTINRWLVWNLKLWLTESRTYRLTCEGAQEILCIASRGGRYYRKNYRQPINQHFYNLSKNYRYRKCAADFGPISTVPYTPLAVIICLLLWKL